MTIPRNPGVNGRNDSRPTLSHEIDRFERMLDGLAEAIPATVADCVKESVSSAVGEAVRATLLELASHPAFLSSLQQSQSSKIDDSANEDRPTPINRIRHHLRDVRRFAACRLRAVGRTMTTPIRAMSRGIRAVHHYWDLRRPVLISLGVGIVVGTATTLAAPWLAGVLSGIAAAGVTLFGQFAAWARRASARFGMG